MIVIKYSITESEKHNLIKRYHSGESVTIICLQTGIHRSTFYSWLKPKSIDIIAPNLPITLAEHTRLKNRTDRLEQIIEVLKKVNCTAFSPTKEKLTELEKLHGQYSVHVLCDALNVARGTFYNHIFRNKRENKSYQFRRTQLSEQIKQVYDESNQIFGAKKIKAVLSERGVFTSDKMVGRFL